MMGHPTSPHKKRKNDFSSPSESSKKKHRKEKSKDKGKAKAPPLPEEQVSNTEFRSIRSSLTLSIPPVFARDVRQGALELLDSMIMRYIPALEGVVLAHSNLRILNNISRIVADSPYLVCNVEFEATVWGPRIGMTLEGKINLCSSDHISLLIHRTFNASIPRHHIPTNDWQFEYGPAENDPEFGGDEQVDDGGKWVDAQTREPLGGSSKVLRFTVVGLTLANEMLSLVGGMDENEEQPGSTYPSVPVETDLAVDQVEHPLEEHAPIQVKRKAKRKEDGTREKKKTQKRESEKVESEKKQEKKEEEKKAEDS
ncbi:hypothetical protein DL96DRAFT_1602599 [Flagelloscypha sp. PMI_526]|nr:hypothetical protein DL96DRAFT_1602599 [Flagelloscypha sp. PMI_526]